MAVTSTMLVRDAATQLAPTVKPAFAVRSGATVSGFGPKPHVIPGVALEQLKLTLPAKPFLEVSVQMLFAQPRAAVAARQLTSKSGGGIAAGATGPLRSPPHAATAKSTETQAPRFMNRPFLRARATTSANELSQSSSTLRRRSFMGTSLGRYSSNSEWG